MNNIHIKAYAKINLTLDITGRRENGYHDVEMVMQKINLYDDVFIEKNNSGKITLSSGRDDLPNDENNIAFKAAEVLLRKFNIKDGIYINIIKRIPVAAGLAGGSSDCAAVLKGLKKLFGIFIKDDELIKIGADLGKDVPFCIFENATMFSYGLGDELSVINSLPQYNIVLAKPNINVSTAWAYKMFDISETKIHPDTKGIIDAIKISNRTEIESRILNVLEYVTAKKYPIIKEYEDFLIENGARAAAMSGSGPSVFGMFINKSDADMAAEKLKKNFGVKEVFSIITL
ncbi:MAG: 4-(cytidine 5'-diphospho)-2-C-methyl-D-erythritol kinase [Clostridia bacterium]|jgi:4-diphosphocytidyl-2-C-methyl-D-erythritol kinase|nr:4-(cytidine 5'-diphospho)-2-C-methyl-D-erythritol kinase [Clostridia bacterium]